MIEEKVKTPGAILAVKICNPEAKETIIFLHGGPGVPDYLDKVAAMFPVTYRIISFDQRGVGNSATLNNSYSVKDYIEDINSIAEKFNAAAFHLYGHSWGGLLAQLYLKEFPGKVKSVFLSNPAPGVGRQWLLMTIEEFMRALKKTNLKEVLLLKLNFLKSLTGGKQADKAYEFIFTTTWKYFFKDPKTAPVDQNLFRGIKARPANGTFMQLLKAKASVLDGIDIAGIPIALLYGTDDFLKKSKKVVMKRFPGARVFTIGGAGHVPWLQDPKEYTNALAAFYKF